MAKDLGGRPTSYNAEIQKKADEYVAKCIDEYKEYMLNKTDTIKGAGEEVYKETKTVSLNRLKVNLPSIEGLAKYINVSRAVIYKWEKEGVNIEFIDTLDRLREEQAERLINMGISGEYNPTIAKLLLAGHGYIEKKEVDNNHSGELSLGGILNELGGKANTLINDGTKTD